MLRRTRFVRCLPLSAVGTGMLVNSSDVALRFPRMQLSTHLVDAGLPELKDCKALFAEDGVRNMTKCFDLLQRGGDVFANIPNWEANEGLCNTMRSIAAARIQLVAELPESRKKIPHIQRSKFVFREAAAALALDQWTRADVQQIDISCFLIGKLVESISHIAPRRDPGSVLADRMLPTEFKNVVVRTMAQLDELLRLGQKAAETHGEKHPSLLWLPIKLTLLKAMTTIAHDGNLLEAQTLITDAALRVEAWGKKRHLLSDKQQDSMLGILMLMRAEIAARIFNWSGYPKETVDNNVLMLYQAACQFYSDRFDAPGTHDGIMDIAHPSRTTYSKGQTVSEDLLLRDSYTTCLLSYGNFLLSAPRSNPKETIFPKGEVFTRNTILTMPSGSDMIYDDCKEPVPLVIGNARKQSQAALERALKLNRLLLPDHKHNEKAGWLLLSMACCFGDLRDYLYATGLLSSATNIFREHYGDVSEEMLFLVKLEERLLNGMGSAKEAETRRHKIKAYEEELGGYAQ